MLATLLPAAETGWSTVVSGARMLVTPPRDEAFLADIWVAIASADGFTAVIDILTRNGLASTPPFLLVEWIEDRVAHLIVRGPTAVTLQRSGSGLDDISAAGVSTWVERTIDDVDGIEFEVAGAIGVGGARLPLIGGIGYAAAVRAEPTLERWAVPAVPDVAAPSAPAVATLAATSSLVAHPSGPRSDQVAQSSTNLATPEPGFAPRAAWLVAVPSITRDDHELGQTDLRGATDAAARLASAEPDGLRITPAPNHEGAALAEPAVAEPARDITGSDASIPEASRPDDRRSGDVPPDGQRFPTSDFATLRGKRRAFPRTEPEREPVPGQLVLVLSPGGEREPLTAPILVGRSPSANRVSGNTLPRLVTMGTADQDISRTHAQFTVEAGTVLVTDLHSRNGTVVAVPGKPPHKLRAGEPTAILVGTVIDFGGGLSIAVEEDSLANVAHTAH